MRKRGLVFGVGINDANYKVQLFIGGKNIKCKFYVAWAEMIRRCYDKKWLLKRPTYEGCTVCEEWLTFSNFKAWMEKQDWEGKHLDKDIIKPGNKIYCPQYCAMVSQSTNSFLTDRGNFKGKYHTGVQFSKRLNKFVAKCSNPFTRQYVTIGYYLTESDATKAYLTYKHYLAQEIADMETDKRVSEALKTRFITGANMD